MKIIISLFYLLFLVTCSILLSSCASIKSGYEQQIREPGKKLTSYRAAIIPVQNKTDGDYTHPGSNGNYSIDERSWQKTYTRIVYGIVKNSGFFERVVMLNSADDMDIASNFDVVFQGKILEIKHGTQQSLVAFFLPTFPLYFFGIPAGFGNEFNSQHFTVEAHVPQNKTMIWSFDSGRIYKKSFNFRSLWGIEGEVYRMKNLR